MANQAEAPSARAFFTRRRVRFLLLLALCLIVGRFCVELIPERRGYLYSGQPMEYWMEACASQDLEARAKAHEVMLGILNTEGEPNRDLAAQYVTMREPGNPQARAVFIRLLKDPRPRTRETAAVMLRSTTPDNETITALMMALNSIPAEDFPARIAPSDALCRLGERYPQTVVPALVRFLEYENDQSRRNASSILDGIRPAARDAVPSLIKTLDDKSPRVRAFAVEALGNIGPAAEESLPALEKCLTDPDESVRKSAMKAIEKINSQAETGSTR